ncbi:MAG: ribokinase [Alphaproteobacteria bacterium]|nr:ribokinase [Alphaproteobacteria bacterium]
MITVFGSINADLVVPVASLPRPGETVIGDSYALLPGGKGANQAVAAAKAGADTALVGAVGDDALAPAALEPVRAAGVDIGAVPVLRGAATGCALIAVDAAGENQIVVARGANGLVDAAAIPSRRLRTGAVLVLQREVPDGPLWSAAERARAAGARVLLNNAPAAPIPDARWRLIDVLVVNRGEALALAGIGHASAGDPLAAARALAASHGIAVAVTLGGAGCVVFCAEGAWRVPVLPVKVLDSTGAGDAFVGAMAAAWAAGRPLLDSVRAGAVAGGLACTALGAQTALPTAAAIAEALPRLPPAERLA